MPIGTVLWFNEYKGFGFIRPEDGSADVFVHIHDIEWAGLDTLKVGQFVSYEIGRDHRGRPSAVKLRRV